jgi:hypothetical protein
MSTVDPVGRGLSWLALAAGCGAIGWATTAAIEPKLAQSGPVPVEHRAEVAIPTFAAPPLGAQMVRGDLFRLARRPAAVPFDPQSAGVPDQTAEPAPRPQLTLEGLVEGRDAVAILEGLPGITGARALRVGEGVGGLFVRRIGGGRVVVVGSDTTWVLRVREVWR